MAGAGKVAPRPSDGNPEWIAHQASAGARDAMDKIPDATRRAAGRIAAGAHPALDEVTGVASQAAEPPDMDDEQLEYAQLRAAGGRLPVTALGRRCIW